ncbi:MAG: HD domain-containing protein [Anaerolineae bacterium]|nr:HD domain-containing protein [Anaerolineae bacterium]
MITVEFARTLYENSDPVHDFDHVLRVLALAQRIGAVEGANMAVVETAVLLHDSDRNLDRAGDESGPGPAAHAPDTVSTDHAVIAAANARHILNRLDPAPDADFIAAVVHAIEAHRFRNAIEPQTLEAKVVFDADKLDAIGAIGIVRAYAYGARAGKKLWAEVSPDYAGGDPDHTPVHEYVYKLARIQERMQTATGRTIARERHAYMVAFFERLGQEVRGTV